MSRVHPEKIKQVDALTKATVAEWKSAIRTAVAAEVVGARIAVGAAKGALEGAAIRAQVSLANNPVKAWTSGFVLGIAKSELGAPPGLPTARMPTAAMQSGYNAGADVGKVLKLIGKLHGVD